MTASDAEAFHRAAVERWKQEPDAIEKLVIKLGWLHLEKAEAILRAKAVEAERDAAEQRAQAAESREAALRGALRMAERNLCVRFEDWNAAIMCPICDQVAQAGDTIDHAPDCPFGLLRAAEGGEG